MEWDFQSRFANSRGQRTIRITTAPVVILISHAVIKSLISNCNWFVQKWSIKRISMKKIWFFVVLSSGLCCWLVFSNRWLRPLILSMNYAVLRREGCWVRSTIATSVLCRPSLRGPNLECCWSCCSKREVKINIGGFLQESNPGSWELKSTARPL